MLSFNSNFFYNADGCLSMCAKLLKSSIIHTSTRLQVSIAKHYRNFGFHPSLCFIKSCSSYKKSITILKNIKRIAKEMISSEKRTDVPFNCICRNLIPILSIYFTIS